ncbi:integrase catalytic domain-containing protein [Trichonephila clavipes]|nr:integrase catalytic domain-containing protein [Trichonephila clavipes]
MALKFNLKKYELISVAVEMGLEIPSKAKIIDLKKLIESSAVYKNDIEFVRSLVENALEKKKAFQIKSVPDELKAEILLNILGERVNNLLTYARKLPSENYVQFASRLSATFDYYCQLRKVNEFRSLCDLIISDKIFETLDRDTMKHIATKQGETYFKPQQLGRECDVYLSTRGKVSNDLMSRNPGSGVKTDGRNRLQTVCTWRQERNSSNVFVAETKPNCVLYVLATDRSLVFIYEPVTKQATVRYLYHGYRGHLRSDAVRFANKAKTFESELMLLVVNKITDLIPNKVTDVDVYVSEFMPLADDKFNIPDRIDMLLGAEIFNELLRPGKFYCDNSHLVLQNTVFGYVVSESVDQVTENRVHCGLIVEDDLNKTLKKFREIEGVHIEPKVDTEVSLCEDHFVRTHRRNCEGRYVVSMALNKDPSCLGNSKNIAIRRLNSLWKRLSRDSSYLSLYAEFLKEYEELGGHLERVVESSEPPTHYYIPHHGVLRPEKLTTKLRIVFNGSSPTTTGISLNDILLKGEVKEDVFETISRFRRHKFAFTTDIQKMYRQILINPDQQDLQHTLYGNMD